MHDLGCSGSASSPSRLRSSEISAALDRVESLLGPLDQATETLFMQLQPVLRHPPPETSDHLSSSTSGVDLADRLESFAERVERATASLRSLAERVAL